tara:strand:- start:541 stop:693 length:153 start_codon:yes stop_codon:yes gene_type:complete
MVVPFYAVASAMPNLLAKINVRPRLGKRNFGKFRPGKLEFSGAWRWRCGP